MRQVKLKLWLGQDFWFCGDIALFRGGKEEAVIDVDSLPTSVIQIIKTSLRLRHLAVFDLQGSQLDDIYDEIPYIDGAMNVSLEDEEEDDFEIESITSEPEKEEFVDEPIVPEKKDLKTKAQDILNMKASIMKDFVKSLTEDKKELLEQMVALEEQGKQRKTTLSFLKKELKNV